MVQVWGAGQGSLKPRIRTDGNGQRETEIEELKWESGRDGKRQTRRRVGDGYSIVKSKVSIRNDLHSLAYGWAGSRLV